MTNILADLTTSQVHQSDDSLIRENITSSTKTTRVEVKRNFLGGWKQDDDDDDDDDDDCLHLRVWTTVVLQA